MTFKEWNESEKARLNAANELRRKPRIYHPKGFVSGIWSCNGVLGCSPHQAYLSWKAHAVSLINS